MPEGLTTITASELLDAEAKTILAARGQHDPTPEQYLAALEQARLERHDWYVEADPSAARAEREQLRRRMVARTSS